jgi:transcription antitermination factor NusG
VCHWIAVRTSPRREDIVAERLQTDGFSHYLPKARVAYPRRGGPTTKALFIGYIFVDLDASTPPWQALRRTFGVVSVIMSGDAPSRCPASEIAKLKASEVDGLITLAGPPPPSNKRFKAGQRVRIRLGAFDGKEAHYVRPARHNLSRVIVVLLSRSIEVSVPTHMLAEIAAVS